MELRHQVLSRLKELKDRSQEHDPTGRVSSNCKIVEMLASGSSQQNHRHSPSYFCFQHLDDLPLLYEPSTSSLHSQILLDVAVHFETLP